ncbi:hypothetical protein [Streptosporangium sp. NPDC087985]|uniref:hypothetical protein n=1 Tax=Streptosporangium sp. NPDC087985 TaxID=3366196 RepID=UPI00381991CC
MNNTIGWNHGLSVSATGKNLIGHAGAVLLRGCADHTGLTTALSKVFTSPAKLWDRGIVLISVAMTIALGARCMSDIELLIHQQDVGGNRPRTPRCAGLWQPLATGPR